MNLKNKVAIVTGARRGIGKAIVLRLANEGAAVVINDIDAGEINQLAEKVISSGRQALSIKADVTSKREVDMMVEKTCQQFGKVDILVNNAGLVDQSPFVDIEEEMWDRIFAVNVKGMFLCCQAVVKEMIKCKQGRIINMSSKSGKAGSALTAHYSASKAAVIGLTQSLAMELARYNITANAICPDFTEDTNAWKVLREKYAKNLGLSLEQVKEKFVSKIPLGRFATVEDIAGVAAFLSSEDASYITGEAINVSGGKEVH